MEQFECVTHRVDESVAPKRRPAPHMKSRLIEPLLAEDVPGDDVAHFTLGPMITVAPPKKSNVPSESRTVRLRHPPRKGRK
jgi:hypothetical protein